MCGSWSPGASGRSGWIYAHQSLVWSRQLSRLRKHVAAGGPVGRALVGKTRLRLGIARPNDRGAAVTTRR
ncbi:hypothetical protein GCM10010319_19150 [Streptomyces blastmyceticus]|uniref:Uncharacterized protein n=1 Tax=Streptomyces blastmyceticus TaxID=68180 RepID=A0ABP3GE10_9ACTN